MCRPHSSLLSALLIAALLSACGGDKDSTPQRGSQGPMQVRVQVLQPQMLDNTIEATGSLLANEAIEVRSEIAGRVTMIGFKEGGTVTKGQVLIKINDDDLQAQLRKTELAMQLASDDEGRKKQLLAVKGISQQAYDDSRITFQSAEADRDNLRAMIAKTIIRAPFSGKIGLRQVSEGGYVSPNTLITDLQQVSPMKVEFSVPERFGNEMAVGKKIIFILDGDSTRYSADVYAIDPAVDVTSRTITVRAHNPNANGKLRPGAFAHIVVELSKVPKALMIPTEALIPDIQGQKVLLIKGGKATSARVETGIRTNTEVELASGVQPGDTVIITGLLQLREGMPVKAAPPEAIGSTEQADSSAVDAE
ncbi:MAG: efflux RND transporter periplasmic adaptor subunit [Flavobacteriales bacterium]